MRPGGTACRRGSPPAARPPPWDRSGRSHASASSRGRTGGSRSPCSSPRRRTPRRTWCPCWRRSGSAARRPSRFHSTTGGALTLAEIGHHGAAPRAPIGRSPPYRDVRHITLAAVTGSARRSARTLATVAAAAAALITADGTGAAGAPGTYATAAVPAAAAAASGALAAARLPLSGKVVGIDPGHNGRNYTDPAYTGRRVWNGREWEDCDTAGTETDGGYTEALFNFRVAGYLRADLIRDGARVVMTRTANSGVGPCVNTRSYLINSGHADGAPAWGRGFAILEPVADGPNDKVIAASARLGADIRAAMLARTAMPPSNYDGRNGISHRDDLAGLNLTKVPKVLIEVGNMKNAADARMLTSATFQRQVAGALLAAIITFLK